jgi:flagellar M-ring protein FliF
VDSTGNELQSSDQKTYVDIANFKLEIEKQYEKNIKKNILEVLAPVVGEQNISIAVKANMSLDKTLKEIITYTPSTDDGKGIVSEEERNQEAEKNGDNVGGVPGAEENADVPNYSGVVVDKDTIYFKDYENYKYLVNKITEQINGESPEVKDLTVGVTINSKQKLLSAEEKENLTQLIANASGVSPAKVTVFNTDFPTIGKEPLVENPDSLLHNKVFILSVSAGTFVLLVGLVLALIISHKIKKRRLAKAEAASAAEAFVNPYIPQAPQEPMPNLLEDLKKVPESKEQVLKKEIQEFSDQNPEIVAQLLRTWLKGDET